MISLIKAEFFKVLKHKYLLFLVIVAVILSLLFNFIYKQIIDIDNINRNYYTNKAYYNVVKEDIKNISPENDPIYYADLKTDLMFFDYCSNHDLWQCELLTDKYQGVAHDYYYSLYNEDEYYDKDETKNKLDKVLAKLDKPNLLEYNKAEKKELEDLLKTSEFLSEYEKNETKKDIERLNLLIDNNIDGNKETHYLIRAIDSYIYSKYEIMGVIPNKNDKEAMENYNYHYEDMVTNKYIIDHHLDQNKFTVANVDKDFFEFFASVVTIFFVIIGGSIVAQEFHKGTIKQLLIKPYTRNQILTSKLITLLLLIPILFAIVFFINLFITCCFSGFKGIFDVIPVYDTITRKMVSYNVFTYNAMIFISKLPYFLIMSLISFAFSAITTSSAVSIAVPIVFNFMSTIVNLFIDGFEIKALRWFVTYIWDLKDFIIGRAGNNLNSLGSTLIALAIYVIVITIIPYIVFNKRDIKNV